MPYIKGMNDVALTTATERKTYDTLVSKDLWLTESDLVSLTGLSRASVGEALEALLEVEAIVCDDSTSSYRAV